MELSIVVAKILALVYISSGIAALSGKISFNKMVEEYERSQGLTFLSGFVTIVIGVFLVEYHNIWVRNWTVLITLIGWLSLFKGVMLIAFPQSILMFSRWRRNTFRLGIFMIIFGLVFGYFGFIAR
ncbi:MAG: hypothetical protein PHS09_05085 [Candidatus Omnitrophica bacterium]|nr:hypothetical protein [Candidatus Omnitrophota bacterium]